MSRLLVGRGTGNRATRRVSPEKFYALLANLLTQFCNKDEIVKIQFLPCPVYAPLCSSSFFRLFAEPENKVTIVFFQCTPLLVFMHAESYVVNVVTITTTTRTATTTKFFAYFHFAQHELRL